MTLIFITTLIACLKVAEPVENPLRKSPNDHRNYDAFVLENGMRALAISDPKAEMSAAALSVHVGQFHDPIDRQGLAHFLEHMLFLGSKKYPVVGDYRQFISGNGGRSNAGTGQENTTYYFEIKPDNLDEALDRFSQFFTAPSFHPDFVTREREAVHSEYSLKIKDDARRYREVRRATSNPKHPFAKFSVGNLNTLEDREGQTILSDLRKFYAKEYSASRMAVAVIGREPLNELKGKIVSKFGAVPTNNKSASPATVPIYTPDQKGVLIQLKPNAEKRSVELQFPAPPNGEHYDHRPVELINFVLGHEGKGSLYQALKQKGWAERLSAGDSGADDHVLFSIKIGLTKSGRENWTDVVALALEMIRKLKNEPDLAKYYEEKKTISELNFKFSEPASPSRAVQGAVRRMLRYPQKHVLDLSAVYSNYDQALVNSYLTHLRLDNLRVILIAPDVKTDQIEPLYQTPYAIAPFQEEHLSYWRKANEKTGLHLPESNPYLAENTVLKSGENQAIPNNKKPKEGLSLWYHHDTEFNVPRSTIDIHVRSPLPNQSIQSRIYNEMFASLINDSLEVDNYPMRLAGVSMGVSASWTGLTLRVSGYDEKQSQMMQRLCEMVTSLTPNPNRFEIIKARKKRAWKNLTKDRPIRIGGRAIDQLFYPKQFNRLDAISTLEKLDVNGFQEWLQNYFDKGSIKAFVYGNQNKDEAKTIVTAAHDTLFNEAEVWNRPAKEIRKLPQGERTLTLDIAHPDSIFMAKYQGRSGEIEEQAKYRAIAHLLKAPFFNELRTKQQLGYTVWAYSDLNDRIPGLRLSIQSSKKDPLTLQQRVDDFLLAFQDELKTMTPADFDAQMAGLTTKLEEKDTAFYPKSNRLKRNLFLDYLGFDHKIQLAGAIKKISKEVLMAFFLDRILNGDRVIVRAFGKFQEGKTQPSTYSSVDDLKLEFTETFSREASP